MLYKHHKVRQMLRSILPSTGAKRARDDKATSHRANRTRVRQACRKWRDELIPDDEWISYDDADDSDLVMRINTADKKRKSEIAYIVRDRRDADKINHFVRWAEAITSDTDDVREKYYKFVGHIGGSTDLIREHAIGHFINPAYDFRDEKYHSWKSYRNGPIAEVVTQDQFRDALAYVVDCNKTHIVNDVFRNNTFRKRNCYGKDPCVTTEVIKNRRLTHYIMDDGSRKPYWKVTKTEDLAKVVDRVYYEHSYTQTYHDKEGCRNLVCLDKKNIDKIIRMLFPRGKPAWGFKEGRHYNRPNAKRIAYEVWKALKS